MQMLMLKHILFPIMVFQSANKWIKSDYNHA